MKVNQLAKIVTEVHDAMQDETYGVDPANTLAMPVLLPPLRIEMPVQEFSTEEAKKEASVHSLDTLILDFSKITLLQIYSIQHATATEIRIWENALAYQAAKETRKEKECKQVINCQRADLAAQEQRQASLEQVIKEATVQL